MELFFLSLPGFLALILSGFLVWRVSAFFRYTRNQERTAASVNPRSGDSTRSGEIEMHDIMARSDALNQRIEKAFQEAVQKFLNEEAKHLFEVTDRLAREYQNLAEDSQGTYTRVIDEASKMISDEARKATAAFSEFVKGEMARYERLTDQGLEEWRRTLKEEIEKKKEIGLKRVEESIYRILFFVSTEVLGKSIDLEGHQELVVRALDDAKRQGFFDI
ncbi:MAG: hypothetical protein CEO22_28 [Candidatus Berkelbacteria bacterium Gr01-1014_85]|uniref:Uncharacterized protein n=1 Tax=Candidatus Berkelbacteria bacterium Gr01-1014_85 TaxID=2017150 RepID=A0A554JE36_9BACT|nr:MAG: hypothetical protein CEO22_28 [Candidatus Berkelbacteria bacterium Gr01-1014_85]